MVICCYEDRPGELLGVKLMVRSVRRHLPDVAVHLCVPAAPPAFERWVARQPSVHLDQSRDATLNGWNAKPLMLLRLLDAGAEEVVWLDSDLIVADDFRRLLDDETSLVATEERCPDPLKATPLRTRAWGFPLGRKVPHLINTAFMRVTPAHRELLGEWARLMRTPEYQAAQKIPFQRRPIHLISDQDVLTALLGAAEFAHLPIQVLRRGRDIIHDPEGGYHPLHRLVNLFRPAPPLVHSQSVRMWNYRERPAPFSATYYNFLHVETSPYGHYARQLASELDEDTSFFAVRSLYGKASWALVRGNPHLPGMAQAIWGVTMANVQRTRGHARHAAIVARRLTGRVALGRRSPAPR